MTDSMAGTQMTRDSMGWRNGPTRAATAVAALLVLAAAVALASCASGPKPEPQANAAPPSPPPPPPPPVDLAGRWKLTAAGGSCFMNFGANPGAVQGTIAPAGGCPGNFFTSRKWTFEHGTLIIRSHKGETLGQLGFAGGSFNGHETDGGALSLSR
jgi:Protease inhibitor Inh